MNQIYSELTKSKGAISIFLTVFILSIILVISLGVAFLMLGQIKMSTLISESLKAFYAADAGAEQALYKTRKENFCSSPDVEPGAICIFENTPDIILDSKARYKVEVKFMGEGSPHEITSFGYFPDVGSRVSRRVKLWSF